MAYTPYDWNQTLQQKSEYIEDRLRDGSPVVGISFDQGLLLLSIKYGQRKVFEVYDRLMFAALGNQSDIETIRLGAIDVAHTEGYTRSPEDVTAHRVVGFAVSPPIKRAFADPFAAPFVVRGIFAELGKRAENDLFYTLDYNGEFATVSDFAVIGGTPDAETSALEFLQSESATPATFDSAAQRALHAWALAKHVSRHGQEKDDTEVGSRKMEQPKHNKLDIAAILKEELKSGELEIGILDRATSRERKFRLARLDETDRATRMFL